MAPVTAIVMVGPAGPSPAELHLADARRMAALDAVAMLQRLAAVERIVVAGPEPELARLPLPERDQIARDCDPPNLEFHFGRRLADVVQRWGLRRVLYAGAGSLPLLPEADLAAALAALADDRRRVAITNNSHSADWVGLNHAEVVGQITHRLERDNMLAWVLQEECGYEVAALPPSAATRLDVDTPYDLRVLALHPRTAGHLRRLLQELAPALNLGQLRQAVRILGTPGSRVTLVGRVAASAWGLLETRTRCWFRVLSEERGMAASGRLAAGQVFSFVADHIGRVGEAAFVGQLARTSDLVFLDTRVFLAHGRRWPSAADRYASDLGQPALIADAGLRRLTEAAMAAPVPIVLGGHNAVSGGLYALLEIAEQNG